MIFTFEKNFKISQVIRGGARETHWVTCHNGLTPKKIKEFLKSPLRFLDLNQSSYGFSSMFSDEHFVSSHKWDSSLFSLFCSSLSILLLKTSFNIIVKILNKFVNKVYNLMMKPLKRFLAFWYFLGDNRAFGRFIKLARSKIILKFSPNLVLSLILVYKISKFYWRCREKIIRRNPKNDWSQPVRPFLSPLTRTWTMLKVSSCESLLV